MIGRKWPISNLLQSVVDPWPWLILTQDCILDDFGMKLSSKRPYWPWLAKMSLIGRFSNIGQNPGSWPIMAN